MKNEKTTRRARQGVDRSPMTALETKMAQRIAEYHKKVKHARKNGLSLPPAAGHSLGTGQSR